MSQQDIIQSESDETQNMASLVFHNFIFHKRLYPLFLSFRITNPELQNLNSKLRTHVIQHRKKSDFCVVIPERDKLEPARTALESTLTSQLISSQNSIIASISSLLSSQKSDRSEFDFEAIYQKLKQLHEEKELSPYEANIFDFVSIIKEQPDLLTAEDRSSLENLLKNLPDDVKEISNQIADWYGEHPHIEKAIFDLLPTYSNQKRAGGHKTKPTDKEFKKLIENVMRLNYSGMVKQHTVKNVTNDNSDRAQIERYTRIEFPPQCILQQEVDLLIQLVVQSPAQNRVRQKVSISTDIKAEKIKLYVHITAPGFSIPQRYKSLLLPLNGDSEEIIFKLVPVDLGRQVVEIELFHECIRVGYAFVETKVKDSVL